MTIHSAAGVNVKGSGPFLWKGMDTNVRFRQRIHHGDALGLKLMMKTIQYGATELLYNIFKDCSDFRQVI